VKNRNDLATDFSKITPIVELLAGEPITSGNPTRFKVLALDIKPEATTVNVYVNYAAPGLAPNDINVTVALDPEGLAAYNTAHGTEYAIPAADAYSLPTTTVTIKKGERFAIVPILVNTSKVDLALQNAVPLKIVDASGVTITANNSALIYALVVKNEYDGDYIVTGWFFHPAAGRAIDGTKHLSTVNAIRLEGSIGDLGSPFQFDVVDNKLVNWSSDAFTSTGFMTADNPGGVDYSDPSNDGHVPGDATFNQTIYNNTYDPVTKTFYMHYGYRAGVVTGESGYTRQIYEKWVRVQ
jgi:hypothetical protein